MERTTALRSLAPAILRPKLSVAPLIAEPWRVLVRPPADADGDSLEQQLAVWTERADQMWLSSSALLDSKGQLASISAAIRGLQFSIKNRDRMQEVERELPSDSRQWTEKEGAAFRAWADDVVGSCREMPHAPTEARRLGLELELELEKNPALLPVFQRIAHDPAFLIKVQNLLLEVPA